MRTDDERILNELIPDNQLLAMERRAAELDDELKGDRAWDTDAPAPTVQKEPQGTGQNASAENVRFITTPGHGYLEVEDTPENRRFFTEYDYERNGKLYLEEDVDAGKWLDAHGIADFRGLTTVYAEDDPGTWGFLGGME